LIAAIHQPAYFPYPGFFHKIQSSDIFVILDNAQYEKHFTNRNKIIVPNGWTWISVPINKNHKFSSNKLVEINNDINWKKEHYAKISRSYRNTEYFSIYDGFLKELYERDWKFLSELNIEIILKIFEWLKIDVKVVKESELFITGTKSERLINCCKKINAEIYLSGVGGKNYIEKDTFLENQVQLLYQQYVPKPYTQRFSKIFIPDLSILDLLMNLGPNSINHIKSCSL
tara:strand:- start:1239 stop:1925 length:687 start_codon:yes stop_codon:yes gene_type:complete